MAKSLLLINWQPHSLIVQSKRAVSSCLVHIVLFWKTCQWGRKPTLSSDNSWSERFFLSLLPVGYAEVFSDPGKQPYAGVVTELTSKTSISTVYKIFLKMLWEFVRCGSVVLWLGSLPDVPWSVPSYLPTHPPAPTPPKTFKSSTETQRN